MATTQDALAYINSMNSRNRKAVPGFMKDRFPKVYVWSLYWRPLERRQGSLGMRIVPGCPDGQAVSEPLVIDGFIADEFDLGDGRGNMSWNAEAGTDVADDFIGARSYSAEMSTHTTNYEWYGVFRSAAEKPTIEELETAYAKLEKFQKMWLADGDRLALQGEKGLEQIGTPHREAAIWLKQPRSWSQPAVAMIECPGCGNSVKPYIAKCGSCGAILDRMKAIKLGLIPDDAPKGKQ